METVSGEDRQSERWIRVRQLALTNVEVSAFTALARSLEANYLSEEDRGRKSEFGRVVANIIERRFSPDGLPISVEECVARGRWK